MRSAWSRTCWPPGTAAWAAGVSPATVQRVWSARGLKPHLVRTFKLSNDRRFDEKLIDVVGVYLNPPDKAVVLCMDEKSQIQALDRTQPSPPLKKGRAGTMTQAPQRRERWFRELTEKAIRRGVFKSVPDLIAAIEAYLQANNNDPKPFEWTATAEESSRSQPRPGRTRINPG
jgi:hypothetical protein